MFTKAAKLLYLVTALLVAVFLLWFWVSAVTWVGHGLALLALALLFLPTPIYLSRQPSPHRRSWRRVNLFVVSGVLVLVCGILLMVPSGQPNSSSPVSQHFTGDARFPRYAITNIVPEAEQVNLGFRTTPYFDPIMTREQARRVSSFTMPLYAEMERNLDFRRLGSAMGWAYADLLGQPYDVGHYYLYVPQNRSALPMPAILFFHGSAGNFKAYTWVWSEFAEAHGYVIVAPSFGFGEWQRPAGARAALRALDDAMTLAEVDSDQVYLAGLSNGGLGVSQLAMLAPERFRGLILISPVMDTAIVDQSAFHRMWTARPVLIVTGEADQRISLSYVNQRINRLRSGGVLVDYVTYPSEDHFLFFSQREGVLNDVAVWLSEIVE